MPIKQSERAPFGAFAIMLFGLSILISVFHAAITSLEMQDIHAHNEHAQNLLIVTQTGFNLVLLALILLAFNVTRAQLILFAVFMTTVSIVTGYFVYYQRYLW